MLDRVSVGVTTWTVPVVAPTGTVAEIAVPEPLMVNAAAVPLNVTLVAPVRLVQFSQSASYFQAQNSVSRAQTDSLTVAARSEVSCSQRSVTEPRPSGVGSKV